MAPIDNQIPIRNERIHRGAVRFGFIAYHTVLSMTVSRATMYFFNSIYDIPNSPNLVLFATVTSALFGAGYSCICFNQFVQNHNL